MSDIAHTSHHDGEETESERLNRELDQLLGELRVAMPGVQVLFAFLLAVPFQQGFADATDFQRDVYFVSLLASAAASAFFVAPTAYHRLMFREREKPMLVAISTKLALVGLACLAVAMNAAVLLVTDVIFSRTTAIVTFVATSALFAGLWFVLGLVRKVSKGRNDET